MQDQSPAAMDPQLIHTVYLHTEGRRWALPVLVVLGLLTALTEGLGIGMMIPLFASLFETGQEAGVFTALFDWFGAGLGQEGRIALLAGTIMGLIVLKSLVQYGYEALSIWFSGHMIHRLRLALFRQLMDVGYAFFASRDQGRLFDMVRGETWLVGEFILLLSRAMISICAVAVFGGLLLLISPGLTLAAALGGIAITLLVRVVARRVGRLGAETVESSAALSKRTIEALGAMRVIRLFSQQDREHRRFAEAAERDRAASLKVELAGAMIQPATEMLYGPLFLGILLFAWSASVAFPTLIAFLVLLYRLQPHARRLDHIRVEIAALLPAVQQIVGLLRRDEKPYIVSGPIPYSGMRESIVFDNVCFSYGEGRRAAITDVSFEIARNRVTALVGESGAGKSTLLNLLCRLYDPDRGDIRVDGVPLRELELQGWRARLAFAGQDADLLGDTIFDAIAYGRPDARREEVMEAARKAHAAEFIERLPQGLDTPVGDRGLQLSAGQRQRIGLARALLCRPDILILDEATSALDSLSESLIQDALGALAGTITIIVIAHRLSTIRDADHVVLMRGGRLVEQGRPVDLLRRKGSAFAKLWELQSGAFAEAAQL
ncbi:ABC transporter ATP-binding protein [Indioceanicola profundi]|uniref:ABC transporter ATP-binding protein n=1 Tax=Indioceanicola profundi TaxID=2220096 RepID=UPI0013C4B561|nr:ABC transporter ATP-binding protein [Indioceanicola profundi]